MKIEEKKYYVEEVSVELKDFHKDEKQRRREIANKRLEYQGLGFKCGDIRTGYEHGEESMKVFWFKGSKKVEINKMEIEMEYRAVLQNCGEQKIDVESVWFTSREKAVNAGETGMEFYQGDSYRIEERVSGN